MKGRFVKISRSLVLLVGAVTLIAACQPVASAGNQPTSQPLYPTTLSSATSAASPTEAAAGTPAATSAPAPTPAASVTLMVANNATLGKILTDGNGMTLYIFKKDTQGVSNCNGQCLVIWPPLSIVSGVLPTAVTGVTGMISTITRSDGSIQVTYNGMPLYYYSGDKQPGDINGQGIAGNWFAATP
jgi:predicted lipoprotein with Yx(FWY)xxD motif